MVLHPSVRIGANVTIYHQVTVGVRGTSRAAELEDGAYVGAGVKIIGAVVVGERAQIGANAVLLRDVPAGATAVGVPAEILARAPRGE